MWTVTPVARKTNNLNAVYTELQQKLSEIVQEEIKTAASQGKQLVRERIKTSGTRKSGKAGRIETGEMLKSVQGKSGMTSAFRGKAEFGWIANKQDYFGYQDRGFVHTSGGTVEGMYALADAGEITVKELELRLKEKLSGL